jgi:hypothetical protein
MSLNPVAAAEVWSDNFDDGNYDGWTVEEGGYRVTDGVLENYFVDIDTHYHIIWNSSSVTEGTWSFDVNINHNHPGAVSCMFMVNGTSRLDYEGYFLRIEDNEVMIGYLIVQTLGSQSYLLDLNDSFDDFQGTWTHFDICRNETGGINVFVNETYSAPVVSSVPNIQYDYSERFVFQTWAGYDTQFDNVVVDDEDLHQVWTDPSTTPTTSDTTPTDSTTPPPPTDMTTMLIIAGGGIAVVVVIVVIVKMRGS